MKQKKNRDALKDYWKDKKKGKIKICLDCKKEFYVSPYYINKKKYCSNKCKFKQMKNIVRSEELKQKISRTLKKKGIRPKQIPWTEERRKKLSNSKKGQNAWNKNSKVRKGEYKYMTRNKIKKPESHWVWFDNFGYFPDKKYVLHHKNFDEGDNRIENLQLVTRSVHLSIHNEITKGKKKRGDYL